MFLSNNESKLSSRATAVRRSDDESKTEEKISVFEPEWEFYVC